MYQQGHTSVIHQRDSQSPHREREMLTLIGKSTKDERVHMQKTRFKNGGTSILPNLHEEEVLNYLV